MTKERETPEFDLIIEMASAIVKDSDGRILLLQRSPKSVYGGLWQLPEGKIEKGEDAETALRRELREELGEGIEVAEIKFVVGSYLAGDVGKDRVLGRRQVAEVQIRGDIQLGREHQQFCWVRPVDARAVYELVPGLSEALEDYLKTVRD